MPYTKEQKITAFRKLPSSMRDFFMSAETMTDVEEVARTNNLSTTQKDKLVDITNELILELITEEICVRDVTDALGLYGNSLANIKKYIQEKIVERIKIIKMTAVNEDEEEAGKEEPPENSAVVIEKGVISNTISDISKKYQLTVEQGGGIENEINAVLSGKTKLSDFRSNIVRLYEVTYDQALKIAHDVNDRIFSSVKNTSENSTDTTTPTLEKKGVLEKQTWSYPSTSTPDHMIPDHNMMEKTDGPHLHSQNIMPQIQPGTGTIIDRKLSGIFKNRATEEPSQEIINRRKEKYKGGDPYREPIE